ncbi:MAG: hypothetical protein U0263_05660 [Polyangiaceae bacterium]
MNVVPFNIPLGEELIASANASLLFSRELTAFAVGGPTRNTEGRMFLTTGSFAFRPLASYPFAQALTLALSDVVSVARGSRRWLSVLPLPGALLDVTARVGGREFLLPLTVDDVDAWIARINAARAAFSAPPRAEVQLDAALAAGETDRARYVRTLARLSFPQAYWHTEALDELRDVIHDILSELGAADHLPWPAFVDELLPQLEVEVETGPEDYERGEGSEHHGRLVQIERIVDAVNRALPGHAPKRFYRFAETLPEWESDEPVWLFLTAAQARRLLELGVVEADGG